jgi:hypothetical protein
MPWTRRRSLGEDRPLGPVLERLPAADAGATTAAMNQGVVVQNGWKQDRRGPALVAGELVSQGVFAQSCLRRLIRTAPLPSEYLRVASGIEANATSC